MMFFQKIKELREIQKRTQTQMASALNVSVATYRKIEKGEKQASREQIIVIAEFLQTDEKELLNLWESEQTPIQNIQTEDESISKGQKSFNPKGVLTGDDIKKLGLIDNETFEEDCIQSASYDLRLGNEYYVPSKQKQECCSDTKSDSVSCPFHKESIPNNVQKCSDENGVLRISPFSTIVFSSEEILKMPNNVIGRFDLRVRFAMQGLVLQVGTQIEPGYTGRLFGLLLNFSDKEICIPLGMRLLTVEFSYTTSEVEKQENDETNYDSLAEFINHFPPTKGTLEAFFERIKNIYGKNQEIQNEIALERSSTKQYIDEEVRKLNEKIREEMTEKRIDESEKYKNKITLILSIAALIVAILIPIIVTYMSKKVIDKDDYPFERIIYVEEENKILKNKKDSLELKILELDNQLNCKSDSMGREISDIKEQMQKLNNNKQNPHKK
ncbi:helix-turn-helix domain-containing protein [Bacteroidales bacterium OttesenSCG-928-I14]|nr:helix-turn-helix domain-containing protein [Bacteroidales bacterium OttesenSCG-928-I14]